MDDTKQEGKLGKKKCPVCGGTGELDEANKECRKKVLTKEIADRIVARDELKGLNTGRKTGLQRSAYYCEECNGWHTSTMIAQSPHLKTPAKKPNGHEQRNK